MSEITIIDSSDSSSNLSGSNMFKYILTSYGGILLVLKGFNRGIRSITPKKHSKIVSFITNIISIAVFILDFIFKVKSYKESKKSNIAGDLEKVVFEKVMGIKLSNVYDKTPITGKILNFITDDCILHIHREAFKSDYDEFTVKGIYSTSGNKVSKNHSENDGTYLMRIDETGNDTTVVVVYSLTSTSYGVSAKVDNIYSNQWRHNESPLLMAIGASYVNSMNIEENMLKINGIETGTMKRMEWTNIHNGSVDFDSVINDVTRNLDNDSRYSIMFLGPPGTGKTSIIGNIVSKLTDHVVVYAESNNFCNEWCIKRFAKAVNSIGKCIIVIEDMDTLEFEDKKLCMNSVLKLFDGTLIKVPVVFMSSVNNAGLIDSAILRPGRTDRIIEVPAPETKREIVFVINKCLESAGVDHEIDSSYISMSSMRLFKKYKMTQSTCRGVVSRCRQDHGYTISKALINKAIKEEAEEAKCREKYSK